MVIAVSVSACSSSKQAVRESSTLATAYEKVDSVKEQVVVAERDTIRDVTTITVRLNEVGDTVKVAQVTERDRLRDRIAMTWRHTERRYAWIRCLWR